jgi:hypothetical protein
MGVGLFSTISPLAGDTEIYTVSSGSKGIETGEGIERSPKEKNKV